MDICAYKTSCILHNQLESVPVPLGLLEDRYCNNNYCQCARYMIHNLHGSHNVPRYLSPYNTKKAQHIILHLNKLYKSVCYK